MKKRSVLFLFLSLILFFPLYPATCVSTGNGAWNNSATWSCGAVPGCNDSIVIQSGHTVSVTTQLNYEACAQARISIYGTLFFQTGNKIQLPCNTIIYLFPGGSIQPGGGGGNSNYIEICSDIVWSAGDGALTSSQCLPPNSPGCGGVLPIELVDFSAIHNNNIIEINWATATEKNNKHFEIERSKDAASFEKINTVPSKALNGNSASVLNYFSADENPLSDISYYRLKQVDKNDASSYSNIVSVNVIKAKNVRFLIYPNPNNGEFTADISGIENNHQVQIILRDHSGTMVYDSSFFLEEVNTKLKIVPQSKLANGVYICTLILEGIEYSVKVVVS
jgi:hypothetical protein